jgi:hypothetical protein
MTGRLGQTLTLGWRRADRCWVEGAKDTFNPRQGRRRLRLLVIVVLGIVAGAVFALRLIDGPYRRLPTGGLIYFGVFFTAGGVLYLVPRVWRWQNERSTWSGKTVFGTMPPRESLPAWRRTLWDLQEWLIDRDARRREAVRRNPRPSQLRASAIAVSLGVTLLLYAALR